MTIKEIETATGMTRANIRFYESEGLLSPARMENGYRSYTEEDLQILRKIKLLRSLQISLEEIKKLHTGTEQLGNILEEHLMKLETDRKEIEYSQKVCKAMKEDGACYQTLNAQKYLSIYGKSESKQTEELKDDVLPNERMPIRRYFARMLDYSIYEVLWGVFLSLVCNVNIGMRSTLEQMLAIVVSLILMLILEPIMLSVFGTTIGKWILGIRIYGEDGRKLSYSAAKERTRGVLWQGMGLQIPFYSWYRMWKCYKHAKNNRQHDWEFESTFSLKGRKGWRIIGYICIHIVVFGILFLGVSMARMPKNRGDITVAEFQENYEQLKKYYRVSGKNLWDSSDVDSDGNGIVIDITKPSKEPTLTYMEQDDKMMGMSLELELENEYVWANEFQNEFALSVLAYMCAQEECSIFSNETDKIIQQIEEHPFEDFRFKEYGIIVEYQAESVGYNHLSGGQVLLPDESTESIFSFRFEMRKE